MSSVGMCRERQATAKVVRQKDKKVKDLTVQMEEERKQAQQYRDQAEKASVRVKQLKIQLEEAQEEALRCAAARRRLQREVDEGQENNKELNLEVSSLRIKMSLVEAVGGVVRRTDHLLRTRDPSPAPLLLTG
ncbi:hypothetical protein CRUP_024826 [Coryphaenoides rupestris]|nr:hypothetical protein CRUP_024826 [Coryphaenoides rupestris]